MDARELQTSITAITRAGAKELWETRNQAQLRTFVSSSKRARTKRSRLTSSPKTLSCSPAVPPLACTALARYAPCTASSCPSPRTTRSTKSKMAAAMSPRLTRSRSLSFSSYFSFSSSSSSSIRSRDKASAFFHRVPAAVLLIALLIVAPAFSAAVEDEPHDDHVDDLHEDEHHDDEPPIEHLFEVYDNDASGGMNATELAGLFASLQEGAEAAPAEADDAHVGHAGHAAEPSAVAVAVTETLSIAHILEAGPHPSTV